MAAKGEGWGHQALLSPERFASRGERGHSPAGLQRRAKRGGGWMAGERGWGLAKESIWRIVFGENKPEFGELQAQGYRRKDS